MKTDPIRKTTKRKVRADRVPASFPVKVGHKVGVTKDISTSGIYFEIEQSQKVGSKIDFVLDLMTPGGPIQVKCHGTVVRIENKNGCVGVAATIQDSIIQS